MRGEDGEAGTLGVGELVEGLPGDQNRRGQGTQEGAGVTGVVMPRGTAMACLPGYRCPRGKNIRILAEAP
jgi:hypothetical protein